jgi:hypothetical protein
LVPPLYDKIADLEAPYFQIGKPGDGKAAAEDDFSIALTGKSKL